VEREGRFVETPGPAWSHANIETDWPSFNALPHGQTAQVTIALQPPLAAVVSSFPSPTDGRGFDPLAAGNGGIGLQSAATRARRQTLHRVAAKKGTRVKLAFPVPSPG